MSWLTQPHPRFVAVTAFAALAAGCGHPPLTAYATPQPIMLGPVLRLRGGAQAAAQEASAGAGRFAVTASSRITATGTPMPSGGAITSTTQLDSFPSVLDAAVIEAIAGDARGRLESREVACSSVVMYAVFYVFAEEQCTIAGRTERPRTAPSSAAATRETASAEPTPSAEPATSLEAPAPLEQSPNEPPPTEWR